MSAEKTQLTRYEKFSKHGAIDALQPRLGQLLDLEVAEDLVAVGVGARPVASALLHVC